MNTTSTSELLDELNAYRALEGKDPIAKWKKSRSDLEALLKTYSDEPETEAEQEERLMDALTEHEAERNEAAEEIGFKEPDTGVETNQGETGKWTQTDEGPVWVPETPAENEPRAKSPRGAIGIMVMDLLQTDMPYKDIVTKVRETYWDAKTTERSIASVAMDLRRDGVNVQPRRKPAAPKTKSTAQAAPTAEEPSH